MEEAKEILQGQGSGGSGGRRSARLAKVALKEKKGKQKLSVNEEDLGYEDFEVQEEEDSKDLDFEDTAYEMGEDGSEEEKEEEQVEPSKDKMEVGNEQDVGFSGIENKAKDLSNEFLKSKLTFLQVQFEDMEKALVTFMKVTNRLMRKRCLERLLAKRRLPGNLRKGET